MFAQRFFRGRINGFSSQNVELRQVQRTCDAISGQKAHGQVVLFMSTGSIPSVDCTVQVHDEDPFTIVLYSFHRPRGKLGNGAYFDESRQENLYRHLFRAWRDLPSPTQPLLFNEVLYRRSHCSEGYALDGRVQESDDDHPLGFALSQTSRHEIENLLLIHLAN